ncbi:MAG TPA: hypothetical protein VLM37_13190 [Fibrobacteraceae bacterium]|nr:hypothetical protein [Fibrobacteraceae bacterium]
MVVGVVVILIIVAVALTAIGAWIVIQGRHEQEVPAYAPIDRSGSYAVLRHPVRDDLERAKPSTQEVDAWLSSAHPELPLEGHQHLLEQWRNDMEHTISVVEEGDREKVATFRVIMTDKDLPHCDFLTTDNYLTREQILNHPEILPPYYPGCGCRLALKQPWDNPSKSGWKAVTPQQDGKYRIPDWRFLA